MSTEVAASPTHAGGVPHVVVACAPGQQISPMLRAQLVKRLGLPVTISHRHVEALPGPADLILATAPVADRVRVMAQGTPVVIYTHPGDSAAMAEVLGILRPPPADS